MSRKDGEKRRKMGRPNDILGHHKGKLVNTLRLGRLLAILRSVELYFGERHYRIHFTPLRDIE